MSTERSSTSLSVLTIAPHLPSVPPRVRRLRTMIDALRSQLRLIVVQGPLGAGKTTFIGHLLSQGRLGPTSVLVNDIGAVNIDHKRLATQAGSDTQVTDITGTCLDCTGRPLFHQKLEESLLRGARSFVIEPTGSADPEELHGVFEELNVRPLYLALLSGTSFAAQYGNNPAMLKKQARRADILGLTKRNGADERLLSFVGQEASGKPSFSVSRDGIPVDMLSLMESTSQKLANKTSTGHSHIHHHSHHLGGQFTKTVSLCGATLSQIETLCHSLHDTHNLQRAKGLSDNHEWDFADGVFDARPSARKQDDGAFFVTSKPFELDALQGLATEPTETLPTREEIEEGVRLGLAQIPPHINTSGEPVIYPFALYSAYQRAMERDDIDEGLRREVTVAYADWFVGALHHVQQGAWNNHPLRHGAERWIGMETAAIGHRHCLELGDKRLHSLIALRPIQTAMAGLMELMEEEDWYEGTIEEAEICRQAVAFALEHEQTDRDTLGLAIQHVLSILKRRNAPELEAQWQAIQRMLHA